MSNEEISMEEQDKPFRFWPFMLFIAFVAAVVVIAIHSEAAAGQYRYKVSAKDYYLPDLQHNCSHYIALHFADAETPSTDASTRMLCQDLDVGKTGDSKQAKRGRWIGRYFFALRDDDQWVDMQVHHIVCRRTCQYNFGISSCSKYA